jgi:L-aminopeptidase/D-esterase-like protein
MREAAAGGYDVRVGMNAGYPEGIAVGNAEDAEAGTGCTVVLAPAGATCSVAVLGGAPATRETDLLAPEKMVRAVHAVVLSGGSAFGLDAASGVMSYLAERDAGVGFGGFTVPIVVGASLFDLGVGSALVRPDAMMGRAACTVAREHVAGGNHGAGCGASVGKLLGPGHAMKSGLGCASIDAGGVRVSAIVAINAAGNVYDRNGQPLAGALDPRASRPTIMDTYEALALAAQAAAPTGPGEVCENTTIGCIVTNAALSKDQCRQVAIMAHDAYGRMICPSHTSNDGDAIFCMSTAAAAAVPDVVGAYAALAMQYAIEDAVRSATSAYGLPAACDL